MGRYRDRKDFKKIDRLRTDLARLRVEEAPLVERAFLVREIEHLEKETRGLH